MFVCLECGRQFHTAKAAELAANVGCPVCGGVDIDAERGDDQKDGDEPGEEGQ